MQAQVWFLQLLNQSVCQQTQKYTNYGSKTELYILIMTIMTPQDVPPLSTTVVPPTVFLH